MRGTLKVWGALALCAAMLFYSEDAYSAAVLAMRVWAQSFAPALFPFFAILPALSCKEAARICERLPMRALPFLFGCPARAAGAIAVGFMAGSPAGAAALSRVLSGMTRAEATRALLLSSGLSPAFLLSAVGLSMFSSRRVGVLLLQSQTLAILASGLLLRRLWDYDRAPVKSADADDRREQPVRGAVQGVLTVCGYMVFFSVLSSMLARVVPALGPFLLPFLEIAGGSAVLSRACLHPSALLPLIAFFCGLSGLSVGLQNLAYVPIPPLRYLFGKILQGALGALFCGLLTRADARGAAFFERVPFRAIVLGLLSVPALFLLNIALRRQKCPKSAIKMEESGAGGGI